jgi:hypothetical protein
MRQTRPYVRHAPAAAVRPAEILLHRLRIASLQSI